MTVKSYKNNSSTKGVEGDTKSADRELKPVAFFAIDILKQ